jgi:uncharacterized protein
MSKQATDGDQPDNGISVPRAGRDDFRAFDLSSFIRAKRETRGVVPVRELERMVTEVPADAPAGALDEILTWSARGEIRRELRREASRPDALPGAMAASHTVLQPCLSMTMQGRTWLECQRCMKAFEFPIDIDVLYKVVDSEEAADAIALDESEAEVIVGSASFNLYDLIDEEVMLSLPMVPKHDVCPAVHGSVVSGVDGSLGVDSVDDIDVRDAAASEGAGHEGDADGGNALAAASGQAPADAHVNGKAVVNGAGRPNPFAALAGLRKSLGEQGADAEAAGDADDAAPGAKKQPKQ